MTEIWDRSFVKAQLMWGTEPTVSAVQAAERAAAAGARDVLIPGVGYGRNAKPFLARGMGVTGIEISETAIALARRELHLDFPIHHGSVLAMPFDDAQYDAIFCYGLLYLLDAAGRAKLLADCARALRPGGQMTFVVIAKAFDKYGTGTRLGDDWFEVHPGMPMFFYDEDSARRELGAYGLVAVTPVAEPVPGHEPRPFLTLICQP